MRTSLRSSGNMGSLLSIRVTDSDKEQFLTYCKDKGITMSDYVRQLLIDAGIIKL